MPRTATPLFNLDAFIALLDRSGYASRTEFARAVGISPGALHDITNRDPDTGEARRAPSLVMVKRFASELKVPLPALLHDPEAA